MTCATVQLIKILEQFDHLAHAAGGARDFDGIVRFLAFDHAEQVNHAGFGDDLDVHGIEFLLVDKARFYFRCNV